VHYGCVDRKRLCAVDAAVARALTATIPNIWSITMPARLTPLGAGQNSLVYCVEAPVAPPCILRVYRNHADLDRVYHELALLAALRDVPLPFAVPTPLATRAGALVHQLRGQDGVRAGALAVLWTELAGAHPDPADTGQAEAVGAALALLDRALAAIDPASLPGHATPPLKELRRRVSAPDDVEDALLQLALPAQDAAELLRLLLQVEAEVPRLYSHLPQQLVHADFDHSQVLMDGAHVTAIIDFEFSHYDLRIEGLMVTLSSWPRDLFGTGAEWGVLEALGRGYSAHVHLLPEEVQALPLLLRMRQIGSLLRDIAWQRQSRVSPARVLERGRLRARARTLAAAEHVPPAGHGGAVDAEALSHDLGSARCPPRGHRPHPCRAGPAQGDRPPAHRRPAGAGGDRLSAAQRLPMEPSAQGPTR
jgi:Ser/Thr protein kinase RdoA (MazF antagonist)